jgi:hypothetical protein
MLDLVPEMQSKRLIGQIVTGLLVTVTLRFFRRSRILFRLLLLLGVAVGGWFLYKAVFGV